MKGAFNKKKEYETMKCEFLLSWMNILSQDNEWVDEWTNEWMNAQVIEWMNGQMNGWMHKWLNGWMEG